MSANYRVVAKGNPQGSEDYKKYYAKYISLGGVSLRQLSNQIAQISTVSSINTLAVLEAMLQVLPQQLADGKFVELGEFGIFKLRIKSNGLDTPEAINANRILPQFTPRKTFKQVSQTQNLQRQQTENI